MPKLQGLIFDLDGTLVDSAPDLLHSINYMLKLHDRREINMSEIKTMLGDGMLTLMQRALNATGGFESSKEMAYFKEFATHYRTITPDPAQIYPHVLETLEQYKAAGVKMGICTNKPADTTKQLLETLGLLKFFGFVAGGDTFEVHKPNPQHLLGVVEALHLSKTCCLMVGDSRNDVSVCRKAEMPCIIVTLGYGVEFDKLEADKLIGDFSELTKAIEEMGFTLD